MVGAAAIGAFVFDAPVFAAVFPTGADFFATFAEVAFFAVSLTLAQRVFWAAAILARAPTLKVRFFGIVSRKPDGVAFLAVDATAVLRTAFFTAFLDFAQRARWASAIFSRASALNVRLVLALLGRLGEPGCGDRTECCHLDVASAQQADLGRERLNCDV